MHTVDPVGMTKHTWRGQHFYMLGDLIHIEVMALATFGNWFCGSGWQYILVQSNIANPGNVESFLQCSHIALHNMFTRSRWLVATSYRKGYMTATKND